MIVFPNCKINLGLNVVRKRDDGYHDVETVFYPLAIKDGLEAIRAAEMSFSTSGLAIAGQAENNLVWKAYQLLKADYPQMAPVAIHLHKQIPMGAGLGGGSADGAFMLQLLNDLFHLQISNAQLRQYAARLGSDCAFFIENTPCLGTGRGEVLQPVPLDLSAYTFVLVYPQLHVATQAAFATLVPAKPVKSVANIIQQPVATWKHDLVNDFEQTVGRLYPEILEIKRALYQHGALYAAMSGSGSAVFGIFDNNQVSIPTLPSRHQIFVTK